jgi:hypothetical protein
MIMGSTWSAKIVSCLSATSFPNRKSTPSLVYLISAVTCPATKSSTSRPTDQRRTSAAKAT